MKKALFCFNDQNEIFHCDQRSERARSTGLRRLFLKGKEGRPSRMTGDRQKFESLLHVLKQGKVLCRAQLLPHSPSARIQLVTLCGAASSSAGRCHSVCEQRGFCSLPADDGKIIHMRSSRCLQKSGESTYQMVESGHL